MAARSKQLAECSSQFMLWPKTGHIYQACPGDRQPPFIDEWRPARPVEIEAYRAAGGVPVDDWQGRTESAKEHTTDESTSPMFYTTMMSKFGSVSEIWAIFQSSDKASSQKRCKRATELLMKDSAEITQNLGPLRVEARPEFYCLSTTIGRSRE